MTQRFIFVHHSGGLGSNIHASTQHLTARQISDAHRSRWNMPSVHIKNSYAGYTFLIERNGNVVQARAIGEETMAQRGFNFNAISICVIGNFNKKPIGSPSGTIDTPTREQTKALATLIEDLLGGGHNYRTVPHTVLDLSRSRIFPHRHVSQTECYGTGLSDQWIHQVLHLSLLEKFLALYQRFFALKQQLGSDDKECDGVVSL